MAGYASVAVLLLAGWAALNPAPMSWAYIAVVIAFEAWLALRMIRLPRNPVPPGEPPYHFSADEARLVGRYRFYFTYPALARESASVLAAIGLTALVLAFWLLYRQAFVQSVLVGVNLLAVARFTRLMTPQPRPEAIPHLWKWSLLERVVQESCTAVPVGDERRAMQLFNPGLKDQWATTSTLIAAVQVLMPGEVARSHRHSPSAIRFIMKGNGAYTAVEGEKVVMREGDLVLTPNWQWHDHGNETGETVVWMDGLDVPLTKALNCIFFEMYRERQVPATKPVNGSQAMYG